MPRRPSPPRAVHRTRRHPRGWRPQGPRPGHGPQGTPRRRPLGPSRPEAGNHLYPVVDGHSPAHSESLPDGKKETATGFRARACFARVGITGRARAGRQRCLLPLPPVVRRSGRGRNHPPAHLRSPAAGQWQRRTVSPDAAGEVPLRFRAGRTRRLLPVAACPRSPPRTHRAEGPTTHPPVASPDPSGQEARALCRVGVFRLMEGCGAAGRCRGGGVRPGSRPGPALAGGGPPPFPGPVGAGPVGAVSDRVALLVQRWVVADGTAALAARPPAMRPATRSAEPATGSAQARRMVAGPRALHEGPAAVP